MILTEKETMLLNDLKSEEKLCIDKYNKYASEACDPQLKNVFTSIGQTEQNHYDTITQMINGTAPSTNMGGSQKPNLQAASQQNSAQQSVGQEQRKNDEYLCTDALGTEKHVSSTYNTCIFEFKDENVRNTLNHIQKEEQEHGKKLYDYLSQNGMYS
ncbi:spore coat protein [Aminipila terrae]|uniref:Spore coat protein n=1 Tax=Aminipila terrae TaxID=2697030 RepID=A0A6P1MBZ1_9FIRM|nr:spore coat protein [Aminipila terrae]QHI71542.1 spore coat protein [Aminipila terrae]